MRSYKLLNKNVYEVENFAIVPIRDEDKYAIMQWRNEQIYHLRQAEPLTKEKQDWYFDNVVAKLFDQEQPNQLLFSFLNNGECIGYGGLVHINWIDKHAEISFIMNTSLEQTDFYKNWINYLFLIEQIAFNELDLNKVYTYSFDLRPKLYHALNVAGFVEDACLNEHCLFEGEFINVLIHRKMNMGLRFRFAELEDLNDTFKWATNKDVRAYSLNKSKISFENHDKWYRSKIVENNCLYYIAEFGNQKIGSFRLDIDEKGSALISYLIDPNYHGRGFGKKILEFGIQRSRLSEKIKKMVGIVMKGNAPSIHIFYKLQFKSKVLQESQLLQFEMPINENS